MGTKLGKPHGGRADREHSLYEYVAVSGQLYGNSGTHHGGMNHWQGRREALEYYPEDEARTLGHRFSYASPPEILARREAGFLLK